MGSTEFSCTIAIVFLLKVLSCKKKKKGILVGKTINKACKIKIEINILPVSCILLPIEWKETEM